MSSPSCNARSRAAWARDDPINTPMIVLGAHAAMLVCRRLVLLLLWLLYSNHDTYTIINTWYTYTIVKLPILHSRYFNPSPRGVHRRLIRSAASKVPFRPPSCHTYASPCEGWAAIRGSQKGRFIIYNPAKRLTPPTGYRFPLLWSRPSKANILPILYDFISCT